MPARVLQLGEKINAGDSSKRNPDHHRKLTSVCRVLLKCVRGENEASGNAALCSVGCSVGESLSWDPGSAEWKVQIVYPAEVLNVGGREWGGAGLPMGEK